MLLDKDDIRVEVLLATWLQNNKVSLDKLVVQPAGTFARTYSQDILQIDQPGTGKGEDTVVHVSREGLYDMLPEAIFHQEERKSRKNVQEATRESERFRAEEKAARRFFLPLEQEFYRQRIWLEFNELRYWFESTATENTAMLLDFWGLNKGGLSHDQQLFMLSVMPQLHSMVGKADVTAQCLEVLLSEKVKIQPIANLEVRLGDSLIPRLGLAELGVDWTLGESWYEDDMGLEVRIGPLTNDKLTSYLPGGEKFNQLHFIYKYVFPAGIEVVTSVLPLEETCFTLDEPVHTARLGYTTTL